MHEQEKRHLDVLNHFSQIYNVRPTLLTPIAHGIAYALGAAVA